MELPPVDPVEFFDGNDRVLALMNMRRSASSGGQQEADMVKAQLCNKIQNLVRSVPGLRDRVVAISEIDPELSAYITALESINAGIWCSKCNRKKDVGTGGVSTGGVSTGGVSTGGVGTGGVSTKDVSTKDVGTKSGENLEYTKLHAHLQSAKEDITLLMQEQASMKTRFDVLALKIENYQTRLNELAKPTKSVPSRFADIKKEDLPPVPAFDISNFVPNSNISADSLLE